MGTCRGPRAFVSKRRPHLVSLKHQDTCRRQIGGEAQHTCTLRPNFCLTGPALMEGNATFLANRDVEGERHARLQRAQMLQ